MVNMEQFWSRGPEQYISGIWAIPGFHLDMVRPDWMHMCCLGVLQYLLGNCFWEMFIELGGVFTNPRTTMAKLENMIEAVAHQLDIRKPVHNVSVTMIRPAMGKKPRFKGKAAQNRHCLPIARELLLNCFSMESDHAANRFHCVQALHECYQEMEAWDPRSSPARLGVLARRHLLLWATLKAETTDPLMWCLYPKHHLWLHTAEQSPTNPRLEWNYSDESEIGTAVGAAKGCNVRYVAAALIQHYRAAFACP